MSKAGVASAWARATADQIAGRLVLPGDVDWNLARQAWNLAADQRPWAVALPETPDEVRMIVEIARSRELRIAPQATGHGALSLGSLEDTILLSTARMRGVQINPASRSAKVKAGELWGDVATAASRYGLAGLAGSSPTVGVVGYSLGGGIGWLARRHGLAANTILAADVVTGEGGLVRASHEHAPDLFWALRGGGTIGIVTALELALYPIREVYGGALYWPAEHAREILGAWRAWTDNLPDEVTSIARLRRMPSRPEFPERLRGRSFVIVEAAVIGAQGDAIELLCPLRALHPDIDTFQMRPMNALGPLHLDPQQPMPRIADGQLLVDVTPRTVNALLAAATPTVASPLASVEIRHLGGALARRSIAYGALASLDSKFAVYAVGMATTPEAAAAIHGQLDQLRDALGPWDTQRRYANFADRGADPSALYPADTLARLREVRARYDPGELIKANHSTARGPRGPAAHS